MNNVKSYKQFSNENLNEGWGARTIGTLLVSLFSMIPNFSKGQMSITNPANPIGLTNPASPLNPTGLLNPASPLYVGRHMSKEKIDEFKESMEEIYYILKGLQKHDIFKNDENFKVILVSVDKLYNDYKDGKDIRADIKRVMELLEPHIQKHNDKISKSTLNVFSRLKNNYNYNKNPRQLFNDYDVIYNEIKQMKDKYNLSDWETAGADIKFLIIFLLAFLAVLIGLIGWMIWDWNRY